MSFDERIELLEKETGCNQTLLIHGPQGWVLALNTDAVGNDEKRMVFVGITVHQALLKAEAVHMKKAGSP